MYYSGWPRDGVEWCGGVGSGCGYGCSVMGYRALIKAHSEYFSPWSNKNVLLFDSDLNLLI